MHTVTTIAAKIDPQPKMIICIIIDWNQFFDTDRFVGTLRTNFFKDASNDAPFVFAHGVNFTQCVLDL